MYQNLVMNPSLISMSPEEFDQHVTRITQAQARAEACARRPLEVPHELPNLAGRGKWGESNIESNYSNRWISSGKDGRR